MKHIHSRLLVFSIGLSALSVKTDAARILFVSNDEARVAPLLAFLEDEGHAVTIGAYTDGIPDTNALANAQVILVTRATNSPDYDNGTEPADWNGVTTPLICHAPHIMRSNRWGWVDNNSIPTIPGGITNFNPYAIPDHPLIDGLSTNFMDPALGGTGLTGALHSNAIDIATFAIGTNTSRGLFLIPEGTPMFGTNTGTNRAIRMGLITGNAGGWANATTNAHQIMRNMIDLALQSIIDADMDGIPDDYELAHGLDPLDDGATNAVNGANGDIDNDNLDNLTEYRLGTFASVADTDMDGLDDDIETNDGTFNDLLTDTGTDPLNPDTDEDGLPDGVETNDGSFNDLLSDTGTHPLFSDTDGDTYSDKFEIDANTDPLDRNSRPNDVNVLFIGGNNPPSDTDAAVLSFLENRYDNQVEYRTAGNTASGDERAFNLLVISSSIGSQSARGKFHNSNVPILNWEEAISDDNDGEFGLCVSLAKSSTITNIVLDTAHPIATGLPENLILFTDTNNIGETTSTRNLFAGLAPIGINAANSNAMLFAAEFGDAVIASAGINGNTSPARRVSFPFTDNTFDALSDDGRQLFGQALDWTAGLPIQRPETSSEIIEPAYAADTLSFSIANDGQSEQILSWSTNLISWRPLTQFTPSTTNLMVEITDVFDTEYIAVRNGPANTSTNGCPTEGDTHLDTFAVTGGPSVYTLTATATDDSEDDILYTFTALSDTGELKVHGPSLLPSVPFNLSAGEWTMSVEVDDDLDCPDIALDARMSTIQIVN